MSNCDEFIQMHSNAVGTIGYCGGCDSFHLSLKGVLIILENNQYKIAMNNLSRMEVSLRNDPYPDHESTGVRISLAKNTFLCLNPTELLEAIELLEIGRLMLNVNDILFE